MEDKVGERVENVGKIVIGEMEEGKKAKPERTCQFRGQWDGSGLGFCMRMKNSNAFFVAGERRDWESGSLWLESRILAFTIYSGNQSRLWLPRMRSWEEVAKMARRWKSLSRGGRETTCVKRAGCIIFTYSEAAWAMAELGAVGNSVSLRPRGSRARVCARAWALDRWRRQGGTDGAPTRQCQAAKKCFCVTVEGLGSEQLRGLRKRHQPSAPLPPPQGPVQPGRTRSLYLKGVREGPGFKWRQGNEGRCFDQSASVLEQFGDN